MVLYRYSVFGIQYKTERMKTELVEKKKREIHIISHMDTYDIIRWIKMSPTYLLLQLLNTSATSDKARNMATLP